MVFVASVAGLKGAPYAAPYAASKHGMVGLMRPALPRNLAKSKHDRQRRLPRALVDTPMVDEIRSRESRSVSNRDEEPVAASHRGNEQATAAWCTRTRWRL